MKVASINRVLVVGAGMLGQQIALQCAIYGYDASIYDIDPRMLLVAKEKMDGYISDLIHSGRISQENASAGLSRVQFFENPGEAAKGVDLLIESVTEDPKIKGQVFAKFNPLCSPHTIFATNTSTLVPSQYAKATGRPAQFSSFHFHSLVWNANVVDIMPHSGTSQETVDTLYRFAISIGQIPILPKKESPGYIFNAMLDKILEAAITLAVDEVASYQDIDRAWMGVSKMPAGPFGILDLIGIDLAYYIINRKLRWVSFIPKARKTLNFLKAYVDRGHYGVKTGQGFYTYPNPAFSQPGFVQGEKSEPPVILFPHTN